MEPQQIVESINSTVNAFDQCTERFDVFKVETKADSSYMIVAGIQDRSAPAQRRRDSTGVCLLTNRWFLIKYCFSFFFSPYLFRVRRPR